ncbi:MAG: hypothetical protein WCX82_01660 [archaeon]|jgi:hypothetical protein
MKENGNYKYLFALVIIGLLVAAMYLENYLAKEDIQTTPITGKSILSIKPISVFSKPNIHENSCGNGICQPDSGENVLTCPQDCFLP